MADSKKAKSKSTEKKVIAFGSVTVKVGELNKSELKRNIKAGQTALARAKGKILKPGIKLDLSKEVPIFYAAPDSPDLIIREQDGKKEKGILVKGKFKPCR